MKLTKLRESKNMSLQQLSQAVGIPAEKLLSWETGENIPNEREVILLANFFNCTPKEITEADVPAVTLITCPKCGSRHLAFVTEYHKAIWCRLFAILFKAMIILLLFESAVIYIGEILTLESHPEFKNLPSLVTLGLLYGSFFLFYILIESKTHIQAICKDCGHYWLMN